MLTCWSRFAVNISFKNRPCVLVLSFFFLMERIEFCLSWWHHRTLTLESCTNKLWSSLHGGHMLSPSPLHPWPPAPCASLRLRDTACGWRWKCVSAKSEETKNVWLQWHVASIFFQEIIVPFNQIPVSRCDLGMPSRANVILKGPNKRWKQTDSEILSEISEAMQRDFWDAK